MSNDNKLDSMRYNHETNNKTPKQLRIGIDHLNWQHGTTNEEYELNRTAQTDNTEHILVNETKTQINTQDHANLYNEKRIQVC